MQRHVWIVAVMIVAMGVSAPAGAQEARSIEGTAYGELSGTRYVERLRELGMVELAEAYVLGLQERGADPLGTLRLLADLEVQKASLEKDEELKDERLAAAEKIYRDLLAQMSPQSTDYVGRTKMYEVQYVLLTVIVEQRAKPYVDRLKGLRGGQADKARVLALLDETLFELEDLAGDVSKSLDRIGARGAVPMSELVILSPRLETLRVKSEYALAWANVNYARAFAPEDKTGKSDRKMMLRDAIELAGQFADNEASTVRWQARLLIGTAQRQQGRYDEALATLSPVSGNSEAKNWVRAGAMFEMCRALAEQGKLTDALAKADVYLQEGIKIYGEEATVSLSLNRAMLRYHAHLQAGSGEAQARLDAAQQELVDFIQDTKFTDHKSSIYAALVLMYRGQTDYENIPSVFLLAKGTVEWREGGDEEKQQAMAALEALLARSDSLSKLLHTDASAELASLTVGDGEKTVEEAARLLALAERDMDHERAMYWIADAVGIYFDDMRSAEVVSDSQRITLVEAIELLLSREDWLKKEPGLAQYYSHLGRQKDKLAGAADDDADRLALYEQAIAAYEKVPAKLGSRDNTKDHLSARIIAMEIRLLLLKWDMEYARSAEGQEAARELRRMFDDFAVEARSQVNRMAADPENTDRLAIIRWGSEAALMAAEITNDPLDNPGPAGQRLNGLPAQWPEATDMLLRSTKLQIRIFIGRGLIAQAIEKAIEKADDIRQERPDEAEALIELVVTEIRAEIARLRYAPTHTDDLKAMQESYLKVAGDLYSVVAGEPIEKRYRQTQMYAESLVENGKAAEAQVLFEECKAHREKEGEAFVKALAERYVVAQDVLNRAAASTDITDRREELGELKSAFLKMLADEGVALESTVVELKKAWLVASAPGDKDVDQQEKDLATVVRYLRQGYRYYYERRAPVDPKNLLGLARCQEALGEYEQAAGKFARLSGMLSMEAHHDLYWSAQLGRIRSSLGAYRDNPERLARLLEEIKSLGLKSKQAFGGPSFKPEFDRIEKEVEALLAS